MSYPVRAASSFLTFVLILLSTATAEAGGGPENLLLVVNRGSDSSKLIANHYIELRDIPACNVLYLDNVPNVERIPYQQFEDFIMQPIVAAVKERNLANQIDYIVYSSDFPTMVTVKSEQAKFLRLMKESAQVGRVDPKVIKPVASITALTYFISSILNKDLSYFSLQSNQYMRSENKNVILLYPFNGQPQEEFEAAIKNVRDGDYDAAIEALNQLATAHPNQVAVSYWLARSYAYRNQPAEAASWLAQAIDGGWAFKDYTKSDLAFESVATKPVFKVVLDRMSNQNSSFLPTRGFRGSYFWGSNGMINSTPDQGAAYVLSTVLAVTRNRGITEREAVDYLKRSVGADGTRPDGTVFFCVTNDVRTTTRKRTFARTVQELNGLGVNAEVITRHFPLNRKDIAGLTMGRGTATDLDKEKSLFVPGAICDNLTSYGGILTNTTKQQSCAAFLPYGASGASGTVVEPFAIGLKFPHARIHVHYARGCSLAESFYQSVHGPFQLLVIGDALCQPWAVRPEFSIDEFDISQPVSGNASMKFDFSRSPVKVAAVEVFLDGRLVHRIDKPGQFNFDSTELADGYHELTFVAVAANEIETKGRIPVPFVVDNSGHKVTLTSERKEIGFEEKLAVDASCNCGETIMLMQNNETLASTNEPSVTFNVSGRKLGRGTVQLRAVVMKDGRQISSRPLTIKVNGDLSATKHETVEIKRK